MKWNLWPDLLKAAFFRHKIWPNFWPLKLHNFVMIAYNGLQFSMHKVTVFGYIILTKVIWSLIAVICYSTTFADISNVRKRYLIANPLTFDKLRLLHSKIISMNALSCLNCSTTKKFKQRKVKESGVYIIFLE